MKTGEVKEKNATTNFSMEFSMINEKFIGLRNKFGYLQVVDLEASSISEGLAKYGGLAKLHFKKDEKLIKVNICSQRTLFAMEQPLLQNLKVYVVDVKNFATHPVATITLPSRVPYGFHGAFMPNDQAR
ncbi:hypothetical protein K7X08_026790 [Anisodus acutangulus]|uniref:Dioxygenase n=1 Tax=Anisodus acutangulus TaxID=402998 RepID=A0A9Q1QXS1_9SOLA|nr:hypothetical protein K7X08_026790 [Anisodus acutangulus]